MMLFTVFMFFTEGPTSPFFMYFTFSVLCATVRWQWRGAAYTSAVSLAAFLGLGLYDFQIAHDPAFDANRVIIRGAYLAVVGLLLSYAGFYQKTLLGMIANLAELPKTDLHDPRRLVRDLLAYVSKLTGARRACMIWEEPEEPYRSVAYLSSDDYQFSHEGPATFGDIVEQFFSDTNFLCSDVSLPELSVLCDLPEGFAYTRRAALIDPELTSRYGLRSVMSLRLRTEHVQGRLFLLDKQRMTSDDLLFGRIVSHRVSILLDQHYLTKQLQQASIFEERIRFARDLHDGLLQSLAGISMKAQAADNLIDPKFLPAHKELRDIQRLLTFEQRDLRCLIQELRPSAISSQRDKSDLHGRLNDLVQLVANHWQLRVELNQPAGFGDTLPAGIRQPLYFIVRESLINSAKHADATLVTINIELRGGHIHIQTRDNGRGFPYRGRYDHSNLCTLHLGPASIRERICELGGTLCLDSSDTGACLDIVIPLDQEGKL